jgi:uncharacterized protein (DUF2141 family)
MARSAAENVAVRGNLQCVRCASGLTSMETLSSLLSDFPLLIMKRRFIPGLKALALASALCAGLAQAAEPNTLTVHLEGVRDATGQIRVSLYKEPPTFRKEAQAFRVVSAPAQPGDQTLQIADVPAGRYAVMAYHDENSNDKLDLRLGMFPMEGYGLSNNPKIFGPPRFEDSAFDVPEEGAEIKMRLAY